MVLDGVSENLTVMEIMKDKFRLMGLNGIEVLINDYIRSPKDVSDNRKVNHDECLMTIG